MRVCIGGTRTSPGPWYSRSRSRSRSLYLPLSPGPSSRCLSLRFPSIHRDGYPPLCRTHGGHRTESDRARPATTQDGCVSLTRGRQTRRGKGNPGINGTCCYVIVGPVPEQRDTGQEARGEYLFSYFSTSIRCFAGSALFPFHAPFPTRQHRSPFHPHRTPRKNPVLSSRLLRLTGRQTYRDSRVSCVPVSLKS